METLKKDGENKKEFNDSGVQDGKNPIDIEQYLFSIFFCSFVFVYMQIIIGRKKTFNNNTTIPKTSCYKGFIITY